MPINTMKRSYVALSLILVSLPLCAQRVAADGVWSPEEYRVTYKADRNKTAIWTYGPDGVIFIDGLGGVTSKRGSYYGYWVQGKSSV